MSEFANCCTSVPSGVEISIKVVPGASRNRIAGILGNAIKIQVAAQPEKGKANQAVIRLLADLLNQPAKDISVIKGHTSPRKTIQIRDIKIEQVIESLRSSQQ